LNSKLTHFLWVSQSRFGGACFCIAWNLAVHSLNSDAI
jgi:hypothetical protein